MDDDKEAADFAAQRERVLVTTRRYFALDLDELVPRRRGVKDALRDLAGYVLGRGETKPARKKRRRTRRALRRGWWEPA